MDHANAQTPRKSQPRRITNPGDAETLPALRPGFCDQCHGRLPKSRRIRQARFCCDACRKQWWTTARIRGAQLYQLAMLWRISRGRAGSRGAGMIARMSKIIDTWRRIDRARREEEREL